MDRMDWKVRVAKRLIDVASSAVGLAVVGPVLPVIAAAIYLESPGPVIFKQKRAGQLVADEKRHGEREGRLLSAENVPSWRLAWFCSGFGVRGQFTDRFNRHNLSQNEFSSPARPPGHP